jgi:hypothetical protein
VEKLAHILEEVHVPPPTFFEKRGRPFQDRDRRSGEASKPELQAMRVETCEKADLAWAEAPSREFRQQLLPHPKDDEAAAAKLHRHPLLF